MVSWTPEAISAPDPKPYYLHPERDWPDGSYLRTLCVHGGKLVGGSTRGVLVVACLATLLGKLKGLRRRSAHFFPSMEGLPPHLQADILATPHSKLSHSDCTLKPGIRLVDNERGISAAPAAVPVQTASLEVWVPLLYTNGDGAPPPAKQGSAGAEGAEIARPTDSASEGPRPSDSLPTLAGTGRMVYQNNASPLVGWLMFHSHRIYQVAFGESFPHLHAHLIPRWPDKPETFAWDVADHYRGTSDGSIEMADEAETAAMNDKLKAMLEADPPPAIDDAAK